MRKILVTGGAGFIGSNLTRKLLEMGDKVVCVDDLNNYYNPKIKRRNIAPFLKHKNYGFFKVDICNLSALEKIFQKEKPEIVCHLAARAGVRASLENPKLYEKVNIGGTINVLDLAAKYGVKKFIFASSSSVYGDSKKIPFSENDPLGKPLSPYAATKVIGEQLVCNFHNTYKIPAIILRFFTVYGPSGRPDMAPFLFTDAIWHGKPIKKFGDGKSMRDYTFVDDVVSGIIAATRAKLKFEIINLGNNKPVELNDFIASVECALGKKAKIVMMPKQQGDLEMTKADVRQAKKYLNWQARTKIDAGVNKFVNWYRQQYCNQ